jgi:hypothetical protein
MVRSGANAMWYKIEVLDSESYELTRDEAQGLKAAKDRARYFMSADYARECKDVAKVNVYKLAGNDGECVYSLYR